MLPAHSHVILVLPKRGSQLVLCHVLRVCNTLQLCNVGAVIHSMVVLVFVQKQARFSIGQQR